MTSFDVVVGIFLVVIIILLLYALRFVIGVYASLTTLKLLQNSHGNFSTTRILVWVCVFIAFVLLLKFLSNKQQTRPSQQVQVGDTTHEETFL